MAGPNRRGKHEELDDLLGISRDACVDAGINGWGDLQVEGCKRRSAQKISVQVYTYKGGTVETRGNTSGSTVQKVVIYTTRRCGYCRKAKAWFAGQGVPYTEYDVENSKKGQRDYQKLGGRGVPIILVGKQRLNGFSESRLGAALRKAGYTL